MKRLSETYNKIEGGDYGEVGFIRFVDAGIRFLSEGSYACVKDYNGIKGFHFAFHIAGTRLVSTPDNYDDVLDYESNLFSINVGYCEDFLSPENDNGVIVQDISNLRGTKLQFRHDSGYMCDIETAETDDIELGEIEFAEWNDENRIINFKCVVGYGVSDVIVGRLNLTPAEQNETLT